MSYLGAVASESDTPELTVRDAAQLAHRDVETVRRWVRTGRLPHRRVGTTILVHRDDLLGLLAGLDEPAALAVPEAWQRTHSGAPMPNLAAAVYRSRAGR